MTRNPNELVPLIINEAARISGRMLQSVILHGDAVSHEFDPSRSVISLLFVLETCSFNEIEKVSSVFKPWLKKNKFDLRFMSSSMLEDCAFQFPVEILGIQHSYRVLHGEDCIVAINICKDRLLEQCRRELCGVLLHASGDFSQGKKGSRAENHAIQSMLVSLLPVFQALLVVYDKKIPHSTPAVIGAIEDLYGFGPSILSEIYLENMRTSNSSVFKTFYDIIKRIYEETELVRIDNEESDDQNDELVK